MKKIRPLIISAIVIMLACSHPLDRERHTTQHVRTTVWINTVTGEKEIRQTDTNTRVFVRNMIGRDDNFFVTFNEDSLVVKCDTPATKFDDLGTMWILVMEEEYR